MNFPHGELFAPAGKSSSRDTAQDRARDTERVVTGKEVEVGSRAYFEFFAWAAAGLDGDSGQNYGFATVDDRRPVAGTAGDVSERAACRGGEDPARFAHGRNFSALLAVEQCDFVIALFGDIGGRAGRAVPAWTAAVGAVCGGANWSGRCAGNGAGVTSGRTCDSGSALHILQAVPGGRGHVVRGKAGLEAGGEICAI